MPGVFKLSRLQERVNGDQGWNALGGMGFGVPGKFLTLGFVKCMLGPALERILYRRNAFIVIVVIVITLIVGWSKPVQLAQDQKYVEVSGKHPRNAPSTVEGLPLMGAC